MKYDEFLEEVQDSHFKPVYFLAGEETGFIDEGVEFFIPQIGHA
jgi:DNA polymerase III delta subunit